jgi:16S rRNA (uracil1498-N3)-methyltransferase
MMSAPRLFVDALLAPGGEIALDKARSHYLTSVMRLGAGAEVRLFNGREGEWRAVTGGGRKAVTLEVGAQSRPQEMEPDIWLAFAPLKKDRMDFVVEKATELGVSRLQPVLTRRTNVNRVNTDRLRAQAIEAAEQCERLTVPEVEEPVTLDQLVGNWPDNRLAIILDESGSGGPAGEELGRFKGLPAACISGPEGGYEKSELDLMRTLPIYAAVSLGPRILRAETAVLASLAIWQSVCGDGGRPPVAQELRG